MKHCLMTVTLQSCSFSSWVSCTKPVQNGALHNSMVDGEKAHKGQAFAKEFGDKWFQIYVCGSRWGQVFSSVGQPLINCPNPLPMFMQANPIKLSGLRKNKNMKLGELIGRSSTVGGKG